MRRAALSLIALGTLALAGARAAGYVATRTAKSGKPLRWTDTNCVVMRPNSTGLREINDGSELGALARAIDNWRRATEHCGYLRLLTLAPRPDALPAFVRHGYNENVVFFVEQGWRHEPTATALTTVKYLSRPGRAGDGKILDADIEVNAEGFSFSTTGDPAAADLEAVLTHELGHVIGLDHPCDDGTADDDSRIDDAGQPIPRCLDAPPEMRATTMFNFAEPGEQQKRTPEADDARGFCETYPLSAAPPRCAPVDSRLAGGCALGPCSASSTSPAPLLLLLALVRRRSFRSAPPCYHDR
jgi:hypothetical protein